MKYLVICFLVCYNTVLLGQCPDKTVFSTRIADNGQAAVGPANLLRILKDYEQCYPGSDTIYENLYRSIAFAYYTIADYERAAEYNARTIKALRINHPIIDTTIARQIARRYYTAFVFYDSLRDDKMQKLAVDSCLEIEKRFGLEQFSTVLLKYKVKRFHQTGDYGQCVKYCDYSADLISRNLQGIDSLNFLFFTLTYKAQSMQLLGSAGSAAQILDEGILLAKKTKSTNYLGSLYSVQGQMFQQSGNPNKALESHRKSWECYREIGYQKGCAESLVSIAVLMNSPLQKQDSSLYFARLALKHADAKDSLMIFDIMGRAMAQTKKYDAAFSYFQSALDRVRPGISIQDLLTMPLERTVDEKSTESLADLMIDWGNACLAKYRSGGDRRNLNDALSAFEKTDAFLEKIKSGHLQQTSKLFWRRYSKKLYENAIEASYLGGDSSRILFFFERSRAVLLNDNIKSFRESSDEDIRQYTKLIRKNTELIQQLDSADAGSEKYATISKEIFDVTVQLEEVTKKANKINSANIRNTPDIQAVRKTLLSDRQALIELFVGDSAVYVFKLEKYKWNLLKIDRSKYLKLSSAYITSVAKPIIYKKEIDLFRETARELFHLLFEPLQIPPGRLIISPDENYFPFEALISGYHGKSGLPKYLLEDYAISYAYSVGHLLNIRSQQAIRGKEFLGFAPVVYAPSQKLSPIVNSDRSLARIGSYFQNPKQYLYSQASLENFYNQFSDYQVIHLYSHAAANLSTGDPVIYFQDSILNLNELIPVKKPLTSLIVLAACESGLGRIYSGEGVFSFNRAFAAIGIPSAMVNLWTVENKSTYQLSEFFYKYLTEGYELDVALQKAKLKYLSMATPDRQLPYYWAASVLTGRSDALEIKQTANKYTWLIAVMTFGFLLGAVLWGRRTA